MKQAGSGLGVGLSLFFLRAKPVRSAGAMTAVVAFILMSAFMILQSFQQSGQQLAEQNLGIFDYALSTGTYVPLGQSGRETDAALQAAATAAGAVNPVVSYTNLDGIVTEDGLAISAAVETADWSTKPFPDRLTLEAGRWPLDASEVAISSALSITYPVGSTLSFFDNGWAPTVVGVALDDYSREAHGLYASAEAWNSLSDIDGAVALRYGSNATRTLYWTGSADPLAVIDAASEVLNVVDPSRTPEALLSGFTSRADLASRVSAPLIEFALGSFIAPFLAGLVGISLATRFINRIRAVMLAIGIAQPRTRSSALAAVATSVGFGLLIGMGLGVLAGYGLRPLLDALSNRVIGPVHDLETMALTLLLASLAGGTVGYVLSRVRAHQRARIVVAKNRTPVKFVVLPILSIAFCTLGYVLAQSAASVDEFISAGFCFALAVVVVLPLALQLLVAREPRRMPALLAIRRLQRDSRQSGWITATISALLVIAFATTTLLTSAITQMNDTNRSSVPPGQIYFTPPADLPSETATGLAEEIKSYLGMTPVTFFVAQGGMNLMVGGTLVVDDVTEFDAITGVELSTADRDLLAAGGTIRTKNPDYAEVTFVGFDGSTHVLPASVEEKLSDDYLSLDGFILRSTADANGIAIGDQTYVFLDASSDQLKRAESAATDLGFDSGWLSIYEEPDIFDEPIQSRLAAAVISMLAVTIMIFYVVSVTRLLRPNLSTLRAIGANRSWLVDVVSTQIGIVLATAIIGSSSAAVLGMFAMFQISGLDFALTVPWQSIGVTVAAVTIGTLAAVLISSSRLTENERFKTT